MSITKRVRFFSEVTFYEVPRTCPSRLQIRDEFTFKFKCDKCKKIKYKSQYYGKCTCNMYVCHSCFTLCL